MISTDIRRARDRLGESQEGFAKRFGVDQTTLSRWETGESAPRGAARELVKRVLSELRSEAAA
jgi:DNA-binding transcriptional regulator YiaG